ncbi:MAG: microcystin degradation protein MlrC [Rhodospirillales bacterium CG15_BIG_FIL_POST_REV_8_21_14_020_66_15]|nr:MAG: microcystin degradation protein MlrC [Rhodospirillales bacterium CG15_BIG_FIL_POST_REV_8_21_14_020_66_15]
MRAVIAMMKHETNTFSPVPTPIERFARATPMPYEGAAAYRAFKGTGSGIGGFIDLAEEAGAEITIPIAANAWPSGPVADAAWDYMAERILSAVKAGCDALFLDLHGAMVTDSREDGEGSLIQQIRAVAPDLPIAVALDMHTNMYPELAENVTSLAGYQTYPHIDLYETARRAGRPVYAMLRGEARPTVAWGNRPMLPHVMRQGSDDFPNRELQEMTRRMETEGALAATLFTGFPHADIKNAGVSAVVVTDGDLALAEKFRDELLDFAWNERKAFVYEIEPLAQSIARAKDIRKGDGPVVLLDHYDNASSGGTQDTMTVLAAILEAGLEDVAAFAVCDPDAVRKMTRAGIGAEITLDLGGKVDMPAIGETGKPLKVTGRVKALTDGIYKNKGPASRGVTMDMGPSGVLDTGRVQICVISRQQEPNDTACFTSLGIDPAEKTFLMLKSRIHYRAGFGKLAKQVIECAGTGVCGSDYSKLDFRNVRRPIYPLDNLLRHHT